MNEEPIDRELEAMQDRIGELQREAGDDAHYQPLLVTALEDLSIALQEISIAMEELRQQNDELLATRQELEAQRERYAALFWLAPQGYLVTDAEGIIKEANRQAATLLNLAQGLLVGKPLLVFISDDDRRRFHTELSRLLSDRSCTMPSSSWSMALQPRERPPFPAEVSVAVVRDPHNAEISLNWQIQDVTSRK